MQKRSKKRLIWSSGIVVLLIAAYFVTSVNSGNKNSSREIIQVKRENIVDKALTVGSIEPTKEITVKSKISGVVGKLYADVGDFIHEGNPLLEIKPNPTPLELVQAERNLEKQEIRLETLKHQLKRNKKLKKKNLISDYEFEVFMRDYEEAELNYKQAKEQMDLLEKGKVNIANKNIESIIKAPITGYVLEKSVEVGDPVVPLTSYQAGTELMKMADMENLLFKGTVDEIDVGRINEGMRSELEIGALPGKEIIGHVSLISLKAKKENNRTVFPVEIAIDQTGDAILRAGFSANANIIVNKKDSVLAIPERVISFKNDSAFVTVPISEEKTGERYIKTGLSDAINIEVVSGLQEGDKVLEKEIKEIK